MSRLAIRFAIAGIPVQVDPGFWLIALLIGMSGTAQGLLIVVPIVFVGVLAHELGHAFMAKSFGAKPEITLYMMGGVTRSAYGRGKSYSRLQSALVTLAGPGAGFLLGGLTLALWSAYDPPADSVASQVIWFSLFVNIGWGVINLMPVLPLDGGNLLRAALSGPGPEVGLMRALWVSVIIGPLVAIASWQVGFTWGALLFGFFSLSSGRQLLDASRSRADQKDGLDDTLETAHRALMDGDIERAQRLSSEVAERSKTKLLRIAALHVLAVAQLEQGDPQKALDTLERLPPDNTDPFLLGACLVALDRPAEAIPPLEQAVQTGEQPRAADLLLQALEQNGDHERAEEVRRAMAEASEPDEAR